MQYRNVILLVVIGRFEVGDFVFNVSNFLKQFVFYVIINFEVVVQGERGVESKMCEVRSWVDVICIIFVVIQEFLDVDKRFEIKDWYVGLNGGLVQGSFGSFLVMFVGFILG